MPEEGYVEEYIVEVKSDGFPSFLEGWETSKDTQSENKKTKRLKKILLHHPPMLTVMGHKKQLFVKNMPKKHQILQKKF